VFVALVTRHAKRMRLVILSSVACLAVQYFSTLSHKQQDFREKKKLLDMKLLFGFSVQGLSEIFLILRRNERDIIIYVCCSRRNERDIIIYVCCSSCTHYCC